MRSRIDVHRCFAGERKDLPWYDAPDAPLGHVCLAWCDWAKATIAHLERELETLRGDL